MELKFKKSSEFQLAELICKTLGQAGYEAYFAGGCVRDSILGLDPHDFDVATNAPPEKVEELFRKTISVGKSFGVISVVQNNIQVEVATFRNDLGYHDGRHPTEVVFSTAEEDCRRRDFTINALFWDPIAKKLIDYVGGKDDLLAKKIRCVGDPEERFAEDHLRILRAIRFQSQLGFALEESTWNAVKKLSLLIQKVSAERVFDELDKCFNRAKSRVDFNRAFLSLIESHILSQLFGTLKNPLISNCLYCEDWDTQQRWCAFFLWLWQNLERRISSQDLQQRLKLSNSMTSNIHQIESLLGPQFFVQHSKGEWIELSYKSEWLKALQVFKGISEEAAFCLNYVNDQKERLGETKPKPLIEAKDLPAHVRGEKIGKTLKQVYWLQLEGRIQNRKEALQWVQDFFKAL